MLYTFCKLPESIQRASRSPTAPTARPVSTRLPPPVVPSISANRVTPPTVTGKTRRNSTQNGAEITKLNTYVCRIPVASTKPFNPAHESCCAALLLWVCHVSAYAVMLSRMFDTLTLSRDARNSWGEKASPALQLVGPLSSGEEMLPVLRNTYSTARASRRSQVRVTVRRQLNVT